jgi:hypothetical protein
MCPQREREHADYDPIHAAALTAFAEEQKQERAGEEN